jgi:arginine deiminase
LIIYGNVVNSTILQAESVRIRNGLNRIIEQVDDAEIRKLIEELISESYQEKPDANKIKTVFNKIKQKAPEIAEKTSPIVIKLLERWLNSS